MVTSELTGEVSMGVLLVFLVFWKWGRYIVPDQQGDREVAVSPSSSRHNVQPLTYLSLISK